MKTFKGKTITLSGSLLTIGDKAPDFNVVDGNLETVSLKDYKNSYILINVVPSLDTPVCDLQTRTLNEEVFKKDQLDIKVVTLSNDLPFAQSRWAEKEELEGIVLLSDYLHHEFGEKYGLYIKENGLLARAAIVLNNKREVIFAQYGTEMSQHLDYDELLDFINTLPGK